MSNNSQNFEQRVQAIQAKIRRPSEGTSFVPASAPDGDDSMEAREAVRRENAQRLRESVQGSQNAQTVIVNNTPAHHKQMNDSMRNMMNSRRWVGESPPYVPPQPEPVRHNYEQERMAAHLEYLREFKPTEYLRLKRQLDAQAQRQVEPGVYDAYISRRDAP